MDRKQVLKDAKELLDQITWKEGPPPKDGEYYACRSSTGYFDNVCWVKGLSLYVTEDADPRPIEDLYEYRSYSIACDSTSAAGLRVLIEHYEENVKCYSCGSGSGYWASCSNGGDSTTDIEFKPFDSIDKALSHFQKCVEQYYFSWLLPATQPPDHIADASNKVESEAVALIREFVSFHENMDGGKKDLFSILDRMKALIAKLDGTPPEGPAGEHIQ